jgi:hypothetical protein
MRETSGELLQEQRARAGVTQTELSARSGVPRVTISRVENGAKNNANGYHYCSFHYGLPPIYFVVCIHSHLGETGHLPGGFDTRFLSLRRFS